jgi:hypothetical protein
VSANANSLAEKSILSVQETLQSVSKYDNQSDVLDKAQWGELAYLRGLVTVETGIQEMIGMIDCAKPPTWRCRLKPSSRRIHQGKESSNSDALP